MADAPANGNAPQTFVATNLASIFIDQANIVSVGMNIRITLGNITGVDGQDVWRQVIVIPDQMAAGLIAALTTALTAKGFIQGEAEEVKAGGKDDAQNRERLN